MIRADDTYFPLSSIFVYFLSDIFGAMFIFSFSINVLEFTHGWSYHAEDGRSGTLMIGNEQFPASLLDLPTVIESYKTYDDSVLIKTADIGQMIMVREGNDIPPDMVEYRHGLTPAMRDARRRRFRREPDLNPELVQRVENDLYNIMRSGSAETAAQEEDGDENARNASKKPAPTPKVKVDTPDPANNAGEADRSDSDESDDSI